jgi:hypothetical protein
MSELSETTMSAMEGIVGILTLVNLLRLAGLWFTYRFAIALYNISPFHPESVPGTKDRCAGLFL